MRSSRLLAILILLQNRGRMTADALAEEFEVSERTIYRDIDALSAAGVPVYGDRGPGGGFALLDGYRTRLTGLADDEAAALALAGVPSAAEAAGFGASLRDAMGKLLIALPGERAAKATMASARFHIDPSQWYRADTPLPHLPLLVRAVLEQQRVQASYASWTSTSKRKIEPLGLVLKGGDWYCVARSERGIGTYRAAGFSGLALLDEGFLHPEDFDLPRWWRDAQTRLEARLFDTRAHIAATALGCERLASLGPRASAALAQARLASDGRFELTMMVEDSDHGARTFLGFGAEVEVLAPAHLRHRIAALAREISQLHRGDEP